MMGPDRGSYSAPIGPRKRLAKGPKIPYDNVPYHNFLHSKESCASSGVPGTLPLRHEPPPATPAVLPLRIPGSLPPRPVRDLLQLRPARPQPLRRQAGTDPRARPPHLPRLLLPGAAGRPPPPALQRLLVPDHPLPRLPRAAPSAPRDRPLGPGPAHRTVGRAAPRLRPASCSCRPHADAGDGGEGKCGLRAGPGLAGAAGGAGAGLPGE